MEGFQSKNKMADPINITTQQQQTLNKVQMAPENVSNLTSKSKKSMKSNVDTSSLYDNAYLYDNKQLVKAGKVLLGEVSEKDVAHTDKSAEPLEMTDESVRFASHRMDIINGSEELKSQTRINNM